MPILSDDSLRVLPDSQLPGDLVVSEYEEGNQRRRIILRPNGKFEKILETTFRFEEMSLDEAALDEASGFTLCYRWEL